MKIASTLEGCKEDWVLLNVTVQKASMNFLLQAIKSWIRIVLAQVEATTRREKNSWAGKCKCLPDLNTDR